MDNMNKTDQEEEVSPNTSNLCSLSSDSSSYQLLASSISKGADIDNVVSFSLCALCAVKMSVLYPEQYNESFRTGALKQMVKHFDLPPKVISSMDQFTPEDEFTFLSSIKKYFKQGPFKLIEELVVLCLSTGTYDARSHYLILEVAELIGVPRELVEIHCDSIYDLLLRAQSGTPTTQTTTNSQLAAHEEPRDLEREKRESKKKIRKYLMIGLASLGGGAVIGVTGGLAAPIVASAFAGVLGAGTVVMSTATAGVVGSLFGVAGAGLTASKMNKRIGDLEEFSFESLDPKSEQTSLTITIAVSGWVSDESDEKFSKPWSYLRNSKEQYCLCYESKYLLELSRAMDYLLSFVVSYATQEALKYTFLASVMAAIAWPAALISIANIIDNPWDVCLGRSAEAGKHLADVLASRQQGKRPASLIGFSLGARLIFFCLQELAKRDNCQGLVGDVVLLGAPVTASPDQWRPLSRVVSGQVINGYSSSDWLLKFLYRTSSAAIRVAGLQPIQWPDRRLRNVDLTHLVTGHMDYHKKLNEILNFVGLRTLEPLSGTDSPDLNTHLFTSTTTKTECADSGLPQSISNATNLSKLSELGSSSDQTHLLPTVITDKLRHELHLQSDKRRSCRRMGDSLWDMRCGHKWPPVSSLMLDKNREGSRRRSRSI